MAPPHCRLSIKAPSPTTIEYTVSTASPPEELPSYCLHYLTILIRISLGILTLCAFCEKLAIAPLTLGFQSDLIRDVSWVRFVPLATAVLFLATRRWHSEESLLVLRTLGIQTTTLSSSYLLPATTRFIPTSQIRDTFIHEAFRGFEVRFYLCVVVEGESEVVVVFP
ncbi:MAG: hypothetical protein Q9184_007118, partial [Pyrenodesmia sp. 2 TL-2023]